MEPTSKNVPPPAEDAPTATPLDRAEASVVSGLRALSGANPPTECDRNAESYRQDGRAAIYDDLYEVIQPCFRAYEDWAAEAAYSAWYERRGRLLVVGCGTGSLLLRLVQRMPARLITAIDLSPEMARRAREKVQAVPEVRSVCFFNYRPVVPFDVVCFTGSLAAMPDLRAAAEQAASMTLHGSRIVICARNGDWKWRNPADERRARKHYPVWYWKRWINSSRIAEAKRLSAPFASPHQELTLARITEAFGGRFGQRDQQTSFGVTRLFENVIAVPRDQALDTVGHTREHRPWMGSIERLRKYDQEFAKAEPLRGGLLAVLFDKLH